MVIENGAPNAPITILFAHGAGADMTHEFMDDIATRLASEHIRVIRFNFPYMKRRALEGRKFPPDRAPKLLAEFQHHIDEHQQESVSQTLFLMGKSMGGRMASHLADDENVAGVICLGFPFHPPKKPDNYKGEHLQAISKPTLILQGERDPFGDRQECANFALSPSVQIDFIPDGDHSLKPRVRSGYTETDNRALVVEKILAFIDKVSNQ